MIFPYRELKKILTISKLDKEVISKFSVSITDLPQSGLLQCGIKPTSSLMFLSAKKSYLYPYSSDFLNDSIFSLFFSFPADAKRYWFSYIIWLVEARKKPVVFIHSVARSKHVVFTFILARASFFWFTQLSWLALTPWFSNPWWLADRFHFGHHFSSAFFFLSRILCLLQVPK